MAIDDAELLTWKLSVGDGVNGLRNGIYSASYKLGLIPGMHEYMRVFQQPNLAARLMRFLGVDFFENPKVADVIAAVRFSLQNLRDKTGLGLIDISIDPLDAGGNIIPVHGLSKSPIIRVMRGGARADMVAAGFEVDEKKEGGADLVIPVTDVAHVRSKYALYHLADGGPGTVAAHGKRALLASKIVALVVPIADREKLKRSGIKTEDLNTDAQNKFPPSIYLYRSLTREGVAAALAKLSTGQVSGDTISWAGLQALGF